MVGLRGLIAYTMKKLKDNKIYRRTFVQKILYFTLPTEARNELFIPYLFGPYSPGIQRLIQYLENNPRYIEEWEIEVQDSPFTAEVDTLVEFIKRNGIHTKHFSQLAKLHFILNALDIKSPSQLNEALISEIKKMSATLGWLEFSKIGDDKLRKLTLELKTLLDSRQT